VKFLNFESKNGLVTSEAMGSKRAAFAHRKLKAAETFNTKVDANNEQFLFVWKGSIEVKDANGVYTADEKDTVFVSGPADLEVTARAEQGTTLIHVQAPQAGVGQ
jgi:redox-sensitive bicupin YhaK (pirin superfamily)